MRITNQTKTGKAEWKHLSFYVFFGKRTETLTLDFIVQVRAPQTPESQVPIKAMRAPWRTLIPCPGKGTFKNSLEHPRAQKAGKLANTKGWSKGLRSQLWVEAFTGQRWGCRQRRLPATQFHKDQVLSHCSRWPPLRKECRTKHSVSGYMGPQRVKMYTKEEWHWPQIPALSHTQKSTQIINWDIWSSRPAVTFPWGLRCMHPLHRSSYVSWLVHPRGCLPGHRPQSDIEWTRLAALTSCFISS